jgi:hypothetical protein
MFLSIFVIYYHLIDYVLIPLQSTDFYSVLPLFAYTVYIYLICVCCSYCVLGEAGSYVFGSISDGVFEGKIVSPQGSYYVEKAHHYFPKDSNKTFHSVIYSEGDIEDPYEHLRTGK